MRNYITVVFKNNTKAYEGLHALWQLDAKGDVTVHGTAVVHRDFLGQIQVDTKETHPALATAVGVGVGAMIGVLAGPVGLFAGAAIGGMVGGITDLGRAESRQQAEMETRFVLDIGHSALIADVSEDWEPVIGSKMQALGGVVYRRAKSDVDDSVFNGNYLYPYEYVPTHDPLWWS